MSTQTNIITPERYREILGHYPTGVVVITAMAADGRPEAMTVGTFTSVSLDPPLVGFLPAKSSTTFPRLRESTTFCVNVLGGHQEALCRSFASKREDRFRAVKWTLSPSGNPIIEGAVAWIDAEFNDVIEVGDHYFVLGSVLDLDAPGKELPLVFFERGYGRFTPLKFVTRSTKELVSVFDVVGAARPILESAALVIQQEIVVSAAVDDQIVHVAAVGTPSIHPSPMVGRRLPLAPPLGALLVAEANDEQKEAWVARSTRSRDPQDAMELRSFLENVRGQGYVLSTKAQGHEELDILLDLISNDVHTPRQEREVLRLLDELRACYDVRVARSAGTLRMLAVPVHAAPGEVPFQIGVHDLDLDADDPSVARILEVLLNTAKEIGALRLMERLSRASQDQIDNRHDEKGAIK